MTTVEQETLPVTLKPCPFCGGEATVSEFITESKWSHADVIFTNVTCGTCDILFDSEPGQEPDAITAWNTRADHEPRAVEVGLREALEALRERCAQMVYQWYDGEPEVAEELRQIVRTVPLAAQSPAPTEGEGILEALDEALKQYAEPLSMLNGHELGERLAGDVAEIVRHARLRAARPSTQPQADAGSLGEGA